MAEGEEQRRSQTVLCGDDRWTEMPLEAKRQRVSVCHRASWADIRGALGFCGITTAYVPGDVTVKRTSV